MLRGDPPRCSYPPGALNCRAKREQSAPSEHFSMRRRREDADNHDDAGAAALRSPWGEIMHFRPSTITSTRRRADTNPPLKDARTREKEKKKRRKETRKVEFWMREQGTKLQPYSRGAAEIATSQNQVLKYSRFPISNLFRHAVQRKPKLHCGPFSINERHLGNGEPSSSRPPL